jgi:hypothetical protein
MNDLIIMNADGEVIARIPLYPTLKITTSSAPIDTIIYVSADEKGRLILEGGAAIIGAIKGEGMAEKIK